MDRNTPLQLSDGVGIRIVRNGMIVEGRDDAVRCDMSILPALGLLGRPSTLEQALAAIGVTSKEEWMSAAAQLLELAGSGVLSCVGGSGRAPLTDHGFGCPEPHIGMLSDRKRTRAYIEAIKRVIRPGDVVVDIGTGTGVLAIAAAQAGARRVYAIERTAIADIASRMFVHNGLADRVTLLRDVSTRVVLPERANVLTSEIIGTDPLGERVLEYTRDAIDRHLLPGGRMVPQRLKISARAVSLPDRTVESHVPTPQLVQDWARAYGMDFSALSEVNHAPGFSVANDVAASWTALSQTITLLDIDLASPPRPPLRTKVVAPAIADGRLDGILIVWEIDLDGCAGLSNDPLRADPDCCWGTAAWLARDRLRVQPGDPLSFSFQYSAPHSTAGIARQ